jgi:SAM-dependent methyltransferase
MVIAKVYPWRERLEANKRALCDWTPESSRVLEFGCATGYMSRVLRDERGCRVTGFEYSAEAAAQAAAFCDRMVVGDIEEARLWDALEPPYDVAVFADVLEHLRDAGAVLRRCRGLLAPHGRLLVSIPNVAHHTVRTQLLRGHFDYTESGLLDETHLRFYTRRSALALVERCGFVTEALTYSVVRTRSGRRLRRLGLGAVERALTSVASGLFPDAMAFQWLILARPAPPGHVPGSTEAPRPGRPVIDP